VIRFSIKRREDEEKKAEEKKRKANIFLQGLLKRI